MMKIKMNCVVWPVCSRRIRFDKGALSVVQRGCSEERRLMAKRAIRGIEQSG